MIEILKSIICLSFLIIACKMDLDNRRVTNKFLCVMLFSLIPFIIIDIGMKGFNYFFLTIVVAVLTYLSVYFLFRMNVFGGADAKILIIISLAFPFYSTFDIPVFSIFIISMITISILPFIFLFYNLKTLSFNEILENPFYLIIGYKCDISNLKEGYFRMLQKYVYDGENVTYEFRSTGFDITNTIINNLEKLRLLNLISSKVWITPGIPFIIPITIGFFIVIFL